MHRARSLIVVLALFLMACGTTPNDRAISGGGIGAAAGAIIGAVTGLTVLEGALIGTGLGAAFGAFSDPEKVNLGTPVWQHYTTTPQRAAAGGGVKASNMVAATQANLVRLGYRPGPIDGRYGPRTRAAIRRYQRDHKQQVDGKMSGQLALEVESRLGGLPQ
jgi:peptidoglycan hydrolase-like protein with peptidoglycan-binding domain